MEIINTILHPVFSLAVRDGYIRSNPTDGAMAEIKKSYNWENPKRYALTEQEQEAFIDHISSSDISRRWLPLFTVFLGTGGRVGVNFNDRNLINLYIEIKIRKQKCTFEPFLIPKLGEVSSSWEGKESGAGGKEYYGA